MKKRFVRRSLLYVPGSSERKMEKAIEISADGIILDLEDAVSMGEKDTARDKVVLWLPQIRRKERLVRINAMDTYWGLEDLIAVMRIKPDTIILPKADVDSAKMADRIMTTLEIHYGYAVGSIGLVPLIETAEGICRVMEILCAAERINGVQLGAEDLTKEMSIVRTRKGREIDYARAALACAGCARKLDILDTPFTDIFDMEGLEADTKRARNFGFTGKTCIHPSHVESLNRLFRPAAEEVEHAKKLLAAFEQAVEEGKGACMFEKKMVDFPIAERARKIIEKEEQILRFTEDKGDGGHE